LQLAQLVNYLRHNTIIYITKAYAMAATKAARKREKSSSSRSKSHRKGAGRWSGKVKTVSTYPPEGLYSKDAETIARVMATKKVSPKGLGSAIRMVQFFINRAGKSLPAGRKHELEKAKHLLQEKRDQKARHGRKPRKPR